MANVGQEIGETIVKATSKEAPRKVTKAVARGQLLDLAEKVKDTYQKTESVKDIADGLEKLINTNDDVRQAVTGFSKNTKKQLDALSKVPEFGNKLGQSLVQKPRSVREAAAFQKANEPAPFTPPTIVSQAPRYQEQGLAGLARTPDITPSGAGGFNPPIETPKPIPSLDLGPAPKKTSVPSLDLTEETPLPSSSGNNRAAALGAGAVVLGGAAATAGLMSGEEKPAGEWQPVARPDGTIGMSDAEFRAIEKEKGTVVAERERAKKYADLNDAFQTEQRTTYRSTGMTPPDLSTTAGQRASQTGAQRFLAERQAAQAEPAPVAPTPAEAPKPALQRKEEPAKEPVPPVGGVLGEATQPAAVPSKNPTPETEKSQASLPTALTDLMQEKRNIDAMTGGGRVVSRQSIINAIQNLEKVDSDIQQLYDKNPPPEVKDISAARREAYEAYKTKANRAEWMGIIDRAINAIGQFATARAALGTPYVGNYKPSYGDYESSVQRALQEYQTEAGILEKEQAESKQVRAQAESELEKKADVLRRGRQLQLEVAKEETRAKQDVVDEANTMTRMLMQSNASIQEKLARRDERAREEASKEGQEKIRAQKDVVGLEIGAIKDAIEQASKLNQAAAQVAANPSDENVAKLTALYPGKLQEEIKQRPEFFDKKKTVALANELVTNNTDQLNRLRQQLVGAQERQKALIGGVAPVEAGQKPAAGGTLPQRRLLYPAGAIVEQGGKKYQVISNYYEGDNPAGAFQEIK